MDTAEQPAPEQRTIPLESAAEQENSKYIKEFRDDNAKTFGIIPRVISAELGPVSFYVNPVVMTLSICVIWGFVGWCGGDEEKAGTEIAEWQTWIVRYWTWFYVGSLVAFCAFICFVMFSRFGDIKLGPEDEPPRFSLPSWFAMLFSAGVGVGLYFFGVAEPVWHFSASQNGNNRYHDMTMQEQAVAAMNLSWFHWGLTASSVYCVVGLPLAYYVHRKNAPLRLSICFHSLLGDYIHGIFADIIDTASVVGTMFGVATSLGLGVMQINAGLHFLNKDIDESLRNQLIIIWSITACATVSVFTGLDVGIRRLSEFNFMFCLFLVFYLFFVGKPFYLLNVFIQGVGYHFNWLFQLTFYTDAFEQIGFADNSSQQTWMGGWTIFYWGWWIAWSPFVGIFIAQISRGRTIREFVMGNLFVPTLFTSIWLTIFGGLGLYHELASVELGLTCDEGNIYGTFKGQDVAKLSCFGTADMLFEMISLYPLGDLMSVLALIGIVTYFVTSSDSASHVIDVLTANGNEEPPKLQRIIWALSEGAVASVLLKAGGSDSLSALQTASIASGLPFCVILLFLCYCFYLTLRRDTGEIPTFAEMHTWHRPFWESLKYGPAKVATAIFAPFVVQSMTYNLMVERCNADDNSAGDGEAAPKGKKVVFDGGVLKYFWYIAFAVPLIFFVIGHILVELNNGWVAMAWAFWVFFAMIGTVQRMRIREYFRVTEGNTLCDWLTFFFCCYSCAVTQEYYQALDGTIDLRVGRKKVAIQSDTAMTSPSEVQLMSADAEFTPQANVSKDTHFE